MAALYTDNIKKSANCPDGLLSKVTQLSDSRLSETSVTEAMSGEILCASYVPH